MNDEHEQVIRWFVGRFVHSIYAQRFVLRMHGLLPTTPDQKKKTKRQRQRMAEYDFVIEPTEEHLYSVTANVPEAAWATGVISVLEDGNLYASRENEVLL